MLATSTSHSRPSPIWIAVYGLAVVAVGLFALVHPIPTRVSGGLLFGIGIVEYGGFAVATGRLLRGWPEVLLGLAAIAVGLALLFNPFSEIATLTWLLGSWLVVAGGFGILTALSHSEDRRLRIFLGTIDAALGIVVLFAGKPPTPGFLATAVAASFLLRASYIFAFVLILPKIFAGGGHTHGPTTPSRPRS